jgi:hypothetical protein
MDENASCSDAPTARVYFPQRSSVRISAVYTR